jgi:HEAT repeat protein
MLFSTAMEVNPMHRSVLSIVAAALLGAAAAPALAQGKPKGAAAAAAEPKITLSPTTAADLASGDPARIRAGLDEARMAGKAAAPVVPQIVALLDKGTSRELAEAALETLGEAEAESAAAAIAPYARHRSLKLRQTAVRALLKTKGPVAVRALRGALSDSDPMVRGLAASGLGALKAKDAVPDLFIALDHRVSEAAASIGILCGESDCEKLAQRLGKLPFEVVTSGLDQVLFRTDVSEDGKIKVIGHLRELGTQESNKFLRDVQKRAQGMSPRLKQALDQAVQATGGGA